MKVFFLCLSFDAFRSKLFVMFNVNGCLLPHVSKATKLVILLEGFWRMRGPIQVCVNSILYNLITSSCITSVVGWYSCPHYVFMLWYIRLLHAHKTHVEIASVVLCS